MDKIFCNSNGLLVRARRLYSSRVIMSSTFYGKGANFSKAESWCGADYTVPRRNCQVLFAGIVQIILLDKSLRGRYNLRKFRKIPERVRKFRIILVNYSKKFLTEKPRARPPGIRLRLVYDQFRKINS